MIRDRILYGVYKQGKRGTMINTVKVFRKYKLPIDKSIMYATHILIIETGELIKFSDKMKFIYSHMLDNYLSYKRANKNYYESQTKIGLFFGLSRKQSNLVISRLKEIGLVEVELIEQVPTEDKETLFKKARYNTTVHTIESLKYKLELVNNTAKVESLKKTVYTGEREKITSDEYMIMLKNKKRWDRESDRMYKERLSPYTDHGTLQINTNQTEYKEFREWKTQQNKQ